MLWARDGSPLWRREEPKGFVRGQWVAMGLAKSLWLRLRRRDVLLPGLLVTLYAQKDEKDEES